MKRTLPLFLIAGVTTACPPIDQPTIQRRAEPANFLLAERGEEAVFEIRMTASEELVFAQHDWDMLVAVDPVPQAEPADKDARLLGTISSNRPDSPNDSGSYEVTDIRGQSDPKPPVMTGFQGGSSGPIPDLGLRVAGGGWNCESGACVAVYYVRFTSLADIPVEAVWSVNASMYRNEEFMPGDRIELEVLPLQ